MVKIPRYKEGNVDFQTTQTDLGEGKVASGSATNFADNVRQLAVETHKQRTNLEAKLRRLEIDTHKNLGKTEIYKNVSEFNDSLLDREDFLTPNAWRADYDKKAEKWKKDFKNKYDEQTWTEFEAIFNNQVFEGRTVINQQIRKQKIKNAGVAYHQSVETYKDKLDKATDTSQITSAWLDMQKIIQENKDNNLFDDEITRLLEFELENEANKAIAWLAVKEGEFIQNPFGENEVDWGGVLRNLNEKVDGKYIYNPDLDPDIRKIMISEADGNFKNQYNTHNSMLEKKNRIVKNNFVNEFIEIRNGTENGFLLANDFAVRVGDSSLMPSEKTAILTQFYAWQNKSVGSTDTWDTPQGIQSSTLAHTLVYEGLIDTETERGFLTEVFWQGLISPDNYRTLNNKIDDNIKEKNQYKKVLYKNAVVMLANEVGSREMSALLSNLQDLSSEDLVLAMQTQFGKKVYDSLNYFNQVLAEGESQGFNYVNMLSNKSSPNYIMDDMVAFAQKARDGSKDETYGDFDWITDIDPTKPYTLATGVWFEGKQPVIPNFEIPLRNDGETIPKYLKRVQLKYKTIRSDLPSTVSGTQFEQDFDINTLDITPTLE